MTASGWLQLGIFVALIVAITKPLGVYLWRVLDPDRAGKRTFLDPVLAPVERLIYWIIRVDPKKEHNWKQYAIAMLIFSVVTAVFTYGMMRLQDRLPLNPQKLPATSEHLAFNTAVSFTTNTNWQSYPGESTMSYLTQMAGLASHNFFSAGVGIAIAAVLIRGISRQGSKTVGNFWVDLVRIHLYVLLPICTVFAVFLVSQGMIQNFRPYTAATTLDGGATQTIGQGPVASQVAIKMLGTNGGGFFNANAAHPFENPTPLSNLMQMLSIFAIPTALTYYLGRMVKKQSHGWTVWGVMFAMFMAGVLVCWWAESSGNPRMHDLGVATTGNMEGKETRFGVSQSALFATVTTDASCGAVNSMHDSFTPLGGLVPLFNIQTGEVIFGGVGAGMYGMLVFVVLAIFIAGLMVGRTPEYLGKKIEGFDIKAAALTVLAPGLSILAFTTWACITRWGQAGLNNNGPHGFSEILYAYTSGAGNNGSAFAGLTTNALEYNTTLGFDMGIGRFFMIIPIMALAGHLAKKKIMPQSVGSFPVSGPTFGFLLAGTVVLVGALTFVPALGLGPILEHFVMHGSHGLY
jgi:potassium-transporting ATPase potassium-binding subunit